MKKLTTLILVLLQVSITAIGQKIDPITANNIAISVYKKHHPGEARQSTSVIPIGKTNDTLLYIVSFDEKGFLIISADRSAPPVLGECTNSIFDADRIPPGLRYLLEKYKYSIWDLRQKQIKPSKEIDKKWNDILSPSYGLTKSYNVGDHLLKTT